MPKVDLKNLPKSSVIHFIGADGIGMSSIAEVLLKMGFAVQGSNEIDGENLEHLKILGAKVFVGHNAQNLNNVDIVVFSSAVPETLRNNPDGMAFIEEFLNAPANIARRTWP